MARVYLGLGSNIKPDENLQLGVGELRSRYGDLDLSAVYKNAALGFDGDEFLNMVVGLDSDQSPLDIHKQIEIIHDRAGRARSSKKLGSRPLDIDLLLYDNLVLTTPKFRIPRADVLRYSFVLRPLAELAPCIEHPETGKTIGEHWSEFDVASHPLEPVSVIL